MRRRSVNFYDLRLMAECIYASKFINEGHAKLLVNTICSFGSDYYGDQIRHDAFLVDRVKTNSKTVLRNISIIRTAMSTTLNDAAHTPEKIRFKYLQHSINDVKNEVERRQGKPYVVNPFCLRSTRATTICLRLTIRPKSRAPIVLIV